MLDLWETSRAPKTKWAAQPHYSLYIHRPSALGARLWACEIEGSNGEISTCRG